VQRGTGRRIAELGRPLAGKTGTTNNNTDTWFIGFTPDLAVGVFVGFDEPRTLGPKDTGSNVAAPIFKTFMREALADQPIIPFRTPPEIRLVRINAETGQLARPGDRRVFLEAFKPGTVPRGDQAVLDGGYAPQVNQPRTTSSSTSGLY
jgi:penicillin-binding protein 1A